MKLSNYSKFIKILYGQCDFSSPGEFNQRILWIPSNNKSTCTLKYILDNKIKCLLITDKYIKKKYGIIKIALFISNDTIYKSFELLLQRINEIGLSFKIYVPRLKDESAKEVLKKNNYQYSYISKTDLVKFKPSVFLFGNDWGYEERYIINLAKILNIPTVCLQESVIDFNNKKVRKMYQCDFPFLQGLISWLELGRNISFLTGNPRYENLVFETNDIYNKKLIIINSNFTYGIHENIRSSWLLSIISILRKKEYEYKILQHPRENADISKFGQIISSNAGNIHNYLKSASIVITRFSSLIHEAILLKKFVVYYNPHKEELKYNYTFDGYILHYCENETELEKSIEKITKIKNEIDNNKLDSIFRQYIELHFLNNNSNATENVINAIYLLLKINRKSRNILSKLKLRIYDIKFKIRLFIKYYKKIISV